MLAINAVSHTRDLDPLATHTAHAGSFATSARSWVREALESVVWAETNSTEKNRLAIVKKRIMNWYNRSPEASVEYKRVSLGEPSRWTYLGLVYKRSDNGTGSRLSFQSSLASNLCCKQKGAVLLASTSDSSGGSERTMRA